MSDLKKLGLLAHAFLEAADFPEPYSNKTLGWKVGVKLDKYKTPSEDPDAIVDNLRKERIRARMFGEEDKFYDLSIKLADYFSKHAAIQKADAEAASLVPAELQTPEAVAELKALNAPNFAAIVEKAAKGETAPVVPDPTRRPFKPMR